MVYTTEKTLNESKDKLSADDIRSVEEALTKAKDTIKAGNPDSIKGAVDELTKAAHKLAETLYKRTAETSSKGSGPEEGQAQGGPDGGKKDDDVVDAEFEDVKK
jgi:molecular chaperone DnaK